MSCPSERLDPSCPFDGRPGSNDPRASHTPNRRASPLSATGASWDNGQAMETDLPVLVVDDQAPFRAAAKAVLRRMDGFTLIGEAVNGEEAVTMAASLQPAMVLMDINMPVMNGVEATRRIVAAHPEVVVVLCSTYTAEDLPSDVSTSGARAYVNKEELAPEELRRIWADRGSAEIPPV